MNKKYALIGWSSCALFWLVYFIMSSIRPDYFHKYKAVSELGTLDAPNAIFWNLFGFIVVGVLISIFSVGLHKSIATQGKGKAAFYALFGCGLFWAVTGIFPGDFENRSSLTMILHTVGSLASGLLFVIAVFSYIPAMRSSSHWRSAVLPSIVVVVLFLVSGMLRYSEAPALGQKIGFLLFFIWLAFMALKLYQHKANTGVLPPSGGTR